MGHQALSVSEGRQLRYLVDIERHNMLKVSASKKEALKLEEQKNLIVPQNHWQ